MKMNLQKDMFDRKLRYKMYKDGKKWVFASMATLSLIGAFLGGGSAHADDKDINQSQTTDSAEQANAPNSDSTVVLSTATEVSTVSDQLSNSAQVDASDVAATVLSASVSAVASSASSASSVSVSLQSSAVVKSTSASISSSASSVTTSASVMVSSNASSSASTSVKKSVASSSAKQSAKVTTSSVSTTSKKSTTASVSSSASHTTSGVSYSVDSAKSAATAVTSIVAAMHSVAATDSAAIAASKTDKVVRNTAMEALVDHIVEEANGVAQSLTSAQYQATHMQVKNADVLMMTVYNVVNNMTFELQQAIQMAAADKRGVQDDVLARAQSAYVNLDVSRFNATAKLSAYGDLIVSAPTNQFAKVVAALHQTGLYDDFRFVVDPIMTSAVNTVTDAEVDAGKVRDALILAHNDDQIYNAFVTGGTVSKTTTSTIKEGTGLTSWTASADSDPTDTPKNTAAVPSGDASSLTSTTTVDGDTQYYNLTGVTSADGTKQAAVKPVAGNVTYKYQLDLSGNFTITGKFFMSNHSDSRVAKLPTVDGKQNAFQGGSTYPSGDFLGLFLSPTDPGTIGGTNGDLGIGGLPDAIAFGIDFFYNSNKGDQTFGTNTNETYQKNGYPVAGFRTTDADGNLTNGTGGVQYTQNTSKGTSYSSTTQNSVPAGILTTGMPYFLSYDATTHVLTASMPKPGSTNVNDKSQYLTWTYTLPQELLKKGVLSLGLLGVTGGNGAVMEASIDVTQRNPLTGKDMHFSGTLVPNSVTVKYQDASGKTLLPDTSMKANVGDKIGIAYVSPNYQIDDYAYQAPSSSAIDSTKYKLISANDVTVSGSKANVMTLVYATRQTATVHYMVNGVANALPTQKLSGWATEAYSTADGYSDLIWAKPGYSINAGYLNGAFDSDDTTDQPIWIYITSNAQTVKTTVTGLPATYATQIASETQTIATATDSTYDLPAATEVPGYKLVVTDAAGNEVKNYTAIKTPAGNAGDVINYTYAYTSLPDSIKVYYTYTDPNTGLVKPIDTKLIGLRQINGHDINYDANGAPYILMTGVTDDKVDLTKLENVTGGFSWDGKAPVVNGKAATSTTAVMNADVDDVVTINFTQQPVIATIYYFALRDGKYTQFAPLGSGTANTFIYKGYANTKMPTDPATSAQLYPEVSGYDFVWVTAGNVTSDNPMNVATDTPLDDAGTDYTLEANTVSTKILSADSRKNNVFVIYAAQTQKAVIKYVDQTGAPVAVPAGTPTSLTGVTGEAYDTTKLTPDVPGYSNPVITDTAQVAGKVDSGKTDEAGQTIWTPQAVTVANSGVFGSNNSTVITVTYQAAPQVANVRYVDQNGNPVVGMSADLPTTLTGTSNSPLANLVTAAMKTAPAGYTYDSTDAATTFDADTTFDQTVTVHFIAANQSATVRYVLAMVDADSKVIYTKTAVPGTTPVSLSGTTGADYASNGLYTSAVTNKAIPGYTRLGIDLGTGKFVDGTNTITVGYVADEATLQVIYYLLDTDNKDNSYQMSTRNGALMTPDVPALTADKLANLHTDDVITLTDPMFKGYVLQKADTDLSGLAGGANGQYTVKAGTNSISYYFLATTQKATVNFVVEDGKQIPGQASRQVTGPSNSPIQVENEIPGWTKIDTDANYFDDDDTVDQVINIRYAQDAQEQAILVTYPKAVGKTDITKPVVTQTGKTGETFPVFKLTGYEIPGYTMLVDGKAATEIAAETADATNNPVGGTPIAPLSSPDGKTYASDVDGDQQVHIITYKANPATLTTHYYLEGEAGQKTGTAAVPGLKTVVNTNLTTDAAVTITDPTAPAGYTLVTADSDLAGVNKLADGAYTALMGDNTITYWFTADAQAAKVTYKTDNGTTVKAASRTDGTAITEVDGVTDESYKTIDDYKTVVSYVPKGYTLQSVVVNGQTYTSSAAALAALDKLSAVSADNAIVMNYKADLQKVVIKFRVNQYAITDPSKLVSQYDMPETDQMSFTLTGTTGQKIDYTKISQYLSTASLPTKMSAYQYDGQNNPAPDKQYSVFDDDTATDQTVVLSYTGKSINYSFVVLSTDDTDAFDANGNFVGIKNGVDVYGKDEKFSVGMGYGPSPVHNVSDFTQSNLGLVFVQTLAGGINPWNTKMMVNGNVTNIYDATTADGRKVKIASVSNATVTIPLGDGTNYVQKFGTGVIKNADGTTTPATSSQDYFYITLNADGTDPNTGKLVTKGAWSLNKPMTGWELYAAGYINNAKNTTDVGYPIAKYSYVQNGTTYTIQTSDESPWVYAYSTMPTMVAAVDNNSTSKTTATAVNAQQPVYAIYYYLKDGIQTVNVNFLNQSGEKIGAGTSTVKGYANTTIDYSPIDSLAHIKGYQLVSDGRETVTTYDTVGVTPQIEKYNQVKIDPTTGKAMVNPDTKPQTVNLIYKANVQSASVAFVGPDGKALKNNVNLPDGVTAGTVDFSAITAALKAIPGYHIVTDLPATATFDDSDNVNGSDAEPQVFTIVYAKDAQTVHVNYMVQNTDGSLTKMPGKDVIAINGLTGDTVDYKSVDKTVKGYTLVTDETTNTTTFDKTNNGTATVDGTPQEVNLVYTANAAKVKIVYRVQQMTSTDGKTVNPVLDKDGNPIYMTVNPQGGSAVATGVYGNDYVVNVSNKGMLEQGYYFYSADFGEGNTPDTETDELGSVTTYPDGTGPKGKTDDQGVVAKHYTFSDDDDPDNGRTLYVTYRPEMYQFDIVYLVQDPDKPNEPPTGILTHEVGFAGGFYSFKVPTLPIPAYTTAGADQGNLNGPYGPKVNGFGLIENDANNSYDPDPQFNELLGGSNGTQQAPHLVVRYTPNRMTVTANYVLVNDKGQVVQSKTSNGMVDTYLSTNMVTTGDMGAEVVGDWRSVGLDGTISATSQASAVKNFDGYKLVDKEGVWSSTPLTFDFDADGDGKDDPVPQTSDEYIDYVTNVYNKFMTAQNKEAEAYNTEHASEIAAGTLTKQTILNPIELTDIQKTWVNLSVDTNNVDHKYQAANNFVTYQYKVDPTITYTYKDSAGKVINKGESVVDADGNSYYSDGTPAVIHVTADMPADGGGAYTVTDAAADIAGFSRSDAGALTFNGNAYVASGVLPSTNYDVVFTAVPQKITTSYVSDTKNAAAATDKMPATTTTVRDTNATYTVDTTGGATIPAGYYVSQITYNKAVVATADSATSGLHQGDAAFTSVDEVVKAVSELGTTANQIEYTLTAAPEPLQVTYSYTTAKVANWTAPKTTIAANVNDTVATDDAYNVAVPTVAGYTAQIVAKAADGTVLNTYTATQFKAIAAAGLAMTADGAYYDVIYTPAVQNIKTSYTLPKNAKVQMTQMTADTVQAATDSTYDVTADGPLKALIPRGYQVATITINGQELSVDDADAQNLQVIAGDNTVVYNLKASIQPLTVNYGFANKMPNAAAVALLPGKSTGTNATQDIDKVSYATGDNYTVVVPKIAGYVATVTNGDKDNQSTIDPTAPIQMVAGGATYNVVYTPEAQTQTTLYQGPEVALDRMSKTTFVNQTATDASFTVSANGPATDVPAGYKVEKVTLNDKDVQAGDFVTSVGGDTVIYTLVATDNPLNVNYQYDTIKGWTAPTTGLPTNIADEAVLTDAKYAVAVPDVAGYTASVVDANGNTYTLAQLANLPGMPAGGETYTVTYTPNAQRVNVVFKLNTTDGVDMNGRVAERIDGISNGTVSYDKITDLDVPGYAYQWQNTVATFDSDDNQDQTVYIIYTAKSDQKAKLVFVNDPKQQADIDTTNGTTNTQITFVNPTTKQTLTDQDLVRTGYTYVLAGTSNAYASLVNLPKYTDADDDTQTYDVTYTAKKQQIGIVQSGLPTSLMTANNLAKIAGYTNGHYGQELDGTSNNTLPTATQLHVPGYAFQAYLVHADGTKTAVDLTALGDQVFNLLPGTIDDNGLAVTQVEVDYTPTLQQAIVQEATHNFETATGQTGAKIVLQTTDAALAKAGYTYTVNGFSSLTDAVAAMTTYDNTDNAADATVDGTPQLFNVVYTANNQSIPVTVVGLPAAKVPNLANLTGVTDSTYNNVPTDVQLKVPGYAYVITDSNNKAVTLDQLKTATFQMNGEQLAVTDYTVTYTAEPTSAKVIYQYDSSATLANAPTLPATTVITGVTDGAYPATTIQTLPGYTTVVVAQSAQVTGQYDAATNQINGTFTADDMSGDNSVYVVTYVPTDHDIKVHYAVVDEPSDATEPSGTFTLPADTKISIKTDKGYQITSVATPGYEIEKIDDKVIDWDKLAKVTETAEDGTIITYYKLDDHTLISSDKLNVTFTNTAAVDATGELQTSHYDITLLPTKQDFDVTYEWADAATQDAANATAKAKIDAQVASPVAKTGIYTDHKYGFSYVVVPGYTATVSGVAHVDDKTDSDLAGAFDDDGKGNVTANMHAVNTSYKVVYSANKQHIDVIYHVADTGMTDVLAVTGLPTDDSGIVTGSLEGQTDMAYTDETSGDFNYKLVKAVPGYTYTITDAAGHVVKDATGKLLFMREADFDLSTLPGTFAVDATTGALIQNQYTITYQADKQQQQITFENPTDPATGKAPVTDPITQTADSNQTFAEVDLGKDYNIPGYTMHIDGEAGTVLASQKADNTDVAYTFDNDATDEALAQSVAATDGTVQKHVVTYVANTDQKASLTIVNKPVSAGDLPIVAPITDGTTDAKVDFGITQSQLYVPGYTFVVTLVGDATKTPVNIDDLRFTRDETDDQAYEVTYTPISQTVNVNYKTDGLTTDQQANVPGSAADFTLTGNTDTNYASATVSGASNAVISGRPGYTFTVSKVHGQGSDATSSAISAATNLGSQATFDLADVANGYTFAVSGTGNESGLAVAGSEQLKTPEIDVAYTALPQHMQVTYAVTGTPTTAQQARVDAGAKDNPTTVTATTDALLSVATAATTMIIHSVDGYTFMIYKKKADGSRGDLVTTDPQTTDFDLTKNALTKDQLFAVDADGNLVMPGYDVVYTADKQTVHVNFEDATTKMAVADQDTVTISGLSDGTIDFTSAQTVVDALIAKGYQVVTGLPTDATLYDNDDANDQTFTVTVRHGVSDEHETLAATSTVAYEGANPAPEANVVSVTVTHTYQTDDVTGNRIQAGDKANYGTYYKADTYVIAEADASKATVDGTTGDITFKTVDTPAVAGYTPDAETKQNVSAAIVDAETGAVSYAPVASTVTYTADAQKVVVKFSDLTTGQPVAKQTDVTIDGVTDGTIDFKTAQDVVDKLVKAGYYVVAGLPTDPVLFDNKDKEDQSFTVTLRHQVTNETEPLTATSTVTYEGANPAPATNVVTVTVNHTYQMDKVTNTRIQATAKDAYVTDYQPDTYTVATADAAKVTVNETTGALTYTTVKTPTVAGYTPDKTSVSNEAEAVLNTETGEYSYGPVSTKVVYTIDAVQKASLHFVNDPSNRADKVISDGKAYETIDFGTTTADLHVPGYSYVITDADGKTYESIDDFVYTATETDSQDYTVTYTALPVEVAVHYDTTELTAEQKTTVNVKDGKITGVTDAKYATANGATTVPAVPGYTFTVTDATGNKVVSDSKDAYDLTNATGTFAVDGDGQPINNEFTVVYTPVDQTVTVNYNTTELNDTQKSQVKAPATATITGKTDALNETADGDTTVKAVPGYTFTVTNKAGDVLVKDAEKDFDLKKVPGQFAVDESGELKNPSYTVVYTPELQQQTVNVTFPASAGKPNVTGDVVKESVTGVDFTDTDLAAKYSVDGYTMYVDGVKTTTIASEPTDTTANGLSETDGTPQNHKVTYVANTDQKATLTFKNDPKHRTTIVESEGTSDETINFGTTTADLTVPGYDYVITDAAGNKYTSIDDFVYTAKEADSQDYTVTYTAKPVEVAVHYDTENLTAGQKTTVNATDGVITGKTDAGYATADGATTVKAVPGYTFTVTDAAKNTVVANSTSDYDLKEATGTFAVNAAGKPINGEFTVVYTPVAQSVAVDYDTANLTPEQQKTVAATDGKLDGVTDAKYSTATGDKIVKAVPGYTFTITDASDKPVVSDATKPFDLTTVAGAFALNTDGKLVNDHFKVVYTPVGQTVAVNYNTTDLNDTQKSQVKAPTTAAITGKTDALNGTADGATTVKSVPGYTFTVTNNAGDVVKDSEKDFDLKKVPGQFAVNSDGTLKNPSYTVVYTPELQQQTVNVTFPASAGKPNVTGEVVNKSVTGDNFTVTDLSTYNVDGYTMLVDGKPATSIAAEATDTTANGLNKTDSEPQLHEVTFEAKADQKATLTFKNDPKHRDMISKDNGVSDTTIDFGTTTAKLHVPGYSYVITDVDGKTYESIDDFVYTAKEADSQDYTVTYTALPVEVAVHYDTNNLTDGQKATVKTTDGKITGVTDAKYATANGATTVPAVSGYTFTVTNASGKSVVSDATKPFDLTTVTGTFAVNEAGQPINDHFTVVYTPVAQKVAVDYDTANLTPAQQATVDVQDGQLDGVTDATYDTATGDKIVKAVPGYTFTIKDASGKSVVSDATKSFDLTTVDGAFALNPTGKLVNDRFTVVYTPVKQTVAVDYNTSNLNETQTSQVKAPTTATITGKTDALNATAAGDTTVKAVPGYTFTVTDASGKPVVENSEKNFDLTKVPGQFAVNANGSLKNPGYNVVYTPELQQQTVNVTFPASANRDNETGTVVNKSVTGQDFTVTDLSSYNVDGYTMLVDGTPATSIAVEATDTTANGLNKTDSKPQLHTVTFVANTDQKARLTFVNDPKQRDQITKNDGESDTTINFGTTTADLAVPGYSYVITDAAGNTYKSIDDFVYTAKEADLQDYTVTYTAEPVTVAVHFDTTTLTKEQQATVNATDGEISGKTDADYTTAQGQTTVPAVPGYTFTVTNAAGKVVAQDATSDFDLTTVSGAFTVNPDGTPKNDHFTVVYKPVEQVVTVNTDTTGLNATQKAQVNVPATATITGKTDALNTTATGATTVKAVPGYTFTVTDAAGHKMVEHSEANFDLTTVPGQFAVNPDGTLQNPSYTVVYTPEVQQQTVNVTFPTSANRANKTGTVVNTTVTGQDFTATDLSNYNVDGYTMLVDGVKTTMINPEATDTTANGTSTTDSAPQVHNVTFVANTDQKATLTFVNDPKHRQPVVETTGMSDTTISFGTKTVDLVVPGYSYVITDAAGKTYTSIDEFVYTAKEADSQDYTVTYTPAVQQQTVTVTFPKAAGRPNIVGQVTQTSTTGVDFATVDLTKYAVPGYTMLVDGRPATSIAPEATDTTPNGLATVDNAPQGHQVTFVANAAKAQIVVIDDTTGATLRVDDVQGVTDGEVVYNSPATIKRYEAMGYVLVSDGFIAGTHYDAIADATRDSQIFEIHLKHDTVDGTGKTQTIVRHTTIKTPDGKVVTVEQVVTVTPHFSVDRVTGERVPDAAVTDKTKYAHAEMPWLETHDRTARTVVSEIKINRQTGETDFGDVQVANMPGYKLVRTNEPNGDQVVTFVATATAPVTPHESVKAPMTTEQTPTVVTVLQPTPSVPVVTSAAPALVSQAPVSQAVITSASAVNVTPTTSAAPLEPITEPDVAVIHDTVVDGDEGLWIHEIPDDKDGDVSDLQNLHDTNVMTNDPYFVALLFATLVAAGMFGVLMAFYRRREATERKLAARRNDGDQN
ncbi:KxYKxGKxW signal peptide domain-containing protein [Weissella cibaria]|uniref:mucin-binding protein n=1 Tax=Weissella cibaria TaxID=137591 RepID=UPI00245662C1|nr:KxYKxGKxW signal peptide domain-containing protein [Weissella cibaria]MDH5012758.1 KxYKxGKxW signal peptide domain-containing protein [Weissella cibaria]